VKLLKLNTPLPSLYLPASGSVQGPDAGGSSTLTRDGVSAVELPLTVEMLSKGRDARAGASIPFASSPVRVTAIAVLVKLP